MKKNIMKLSALIVVMLMFSAATMVFASNWTSEVSISTPNWGKVTYQNTIYDGKDTNSAYGSIYATYQKTSLAHSVALTYNNYQNNKVIGSDWATMKVDVIKRPELVITSFGTVYWSAAKSHNFEPTNGTIIKYKFSSDEM